MSQVKMIEQSILTNYWIEYNLKVSSDSATLRLNDFTLTPITQTKKFDRPANLSPSGTNTFEFKPDGITALFK